MEGGFTRLRRCISVLTWYTVAAFAVYVCYALTRYRQFLVSGYDLGIFDQAVSRYAHFESPMVPLKGDFYNILGDHFHPILVVLVPLCWVWDDPRTLLIAQAGLIAASIPIVFRFMDRKLLGTPRWVMWLLISGYAISWPLQQMIDFDFHEVCFAVPLIALAIDGLDRHSDKRLLWGALPLLAVREDMGVIVAILGLLRIFQRPRRWVGAAMAGLGIVAFGVIIKVVIPHFASNGDFAYWDYAELGPNVASSIGFIVTHPLTTTSTFFTPLVKTTTMLYLFAPLCFLPLLSPLTITALPLLAQRFLSTRTMLWTTHFHYSAPIMVIFMLGAVDGLARLADWMKKPAVARRVLTMLLAVVQLLFPLGDTAAGRGNYPLGRLLGPAWALDQHMRDKTDVIKAIPPGTCLEVDDRFAPYLTHRNRVTLPGLSTRHPADFVVLDMTQKDVGFQLSAPAVVRQRVIAEGYTQWLQRDPYIVYQRPGYVGSSAGCGPHEP